MGLPDSCVGYRCNTPSCLRGNSYSAVEKIPIDTHAIKIIYKDSYPELQSFWPQFEASMPRPDVLGTMDMIENVRAHIHAQCI